MIFVILLIVSLLVKTPFWSSRGLQLAGEKLIAALTAAAAAALVGVLICVLPYPESVFGLIGIPVLLFAAATVLEYVLMGLAFGFREFPFAYSLLSNLLTALLFGLVFLLCCVSGLVPGFPAIL